MRLSLQRRPAAVAEHACATSSRRSARPGGVARAVGDRERPLARALEAARRARPAGAARARSARRHRARTRSSWCCIHEEAGRAALAGAADRDDGGRRAAACAMRAAELAATLAAAHRRGRCDRRGRAPRDAASSRTRTSPDLLLLARGDDALHAVAARGGAHHALSPRTIPSRQLASVAFERAARAARGARARARRELLAAALDRGALACAAQALGVVRSHARARGRVHAASASSSASRSARSRP